MTLVIPRPLDQQDGEQQALMPHLDLVERPYAYHFTWIIDNFSQLNTNKIYSDVFKIGGYKWRVAIFPKGNNVHYLSMYLDVADSATLPHGWRRYARFGLGVVNQILNKYTIKKDTEHRFSSRESDWGFTTFMPLSDLLDPHKGYLVNDRCVIEACIVAPTAND